MAAHAVVVISAFFTALDDLDRQLGAALNSASLELTQGRVKITLGDHRYAR